MDVIISNPPMHLIISCVPVRTVPMATPTGFNMLMFDLRTMSKPFSGSESFTTTATVNRCPSLLEGPGMRAGEIGQEDALAWAIQTMLVTGEAKTTKETVAL